jgi:hypothetical protein
VLYFVIPFTIAISIMGTRELWLNVVVPWQKRRRLNGNGNGHCAPSVAAPAPTSAPKHAPQPAPAPVAQPVKRRKA